VSVAEYPRWSDITALSQFQSADPDARRTIATDWATGLRDQVQAEEGTFTSEQNTAFVRSLAQDIPDLDPEQFGVSDPNSFIDTASESFQRGVLQLRQIGNLVQKDTQELAEVSRELQALPPSDALVRFSQSDTVADSLAAFSDNPLNILTSLIVQSAVTSVGSLALGAAGGTVSGGPVGTAVGTGVGVFAGSTMTEGALEYIGTIEAGGVDITDPEALDRFFRQNTQESRDLHDLAVQRGATKGGVIGLLDGITAGLAGKVFKILSGAKRVKTATEVVRNAATASEKTAAREALKETVASLSTAKIATGVVGETLVDAVAGGAGEALGSRAIGEEATLGDILAEGIAGPTTTLPFAARNIGTDFGLTPEDVELIRSLDTRVTEEAMAAGQPEVAPEPVVEAPVVTPEPVAVEEPVVAAAEDVVTQVPDEPTPPAVAEPVADIAPEPVEAPPAMAEIAKPKGRTKDDRITAMEETLASVQKAIADNPDLPGLDLENISDIANDVNAARPEKHVLKVVKDTEARLNTLVNEFNEAIETAPTPGEVAVAAEAEGQVAEREPTDAEVAAEEVPQQPAPVGPILTPEQTASIVERSGDMTVPELKAAIARLPETAAVERATLQETLDFIEADDAQLMALPRSNVEHLPSSTPVTPDTFGSRIRKVRQLRTTIKELSEAFGVPIRVGKIKERALGIFKPGSGVIRTAIANDMQVTAHEIGHAIDDRFHFSSDPALHKELTSEHLGQRTSRASYSKAKIAREGVAEFFRILVINENQAQEIAPTMYATFLQRIAADPKMSAAVNLAKDRFAELIGQTPTERIAATIAWGTDPEPGTNFERAMIGWFDRIYPLKQAMTEAYDAGGPAILSDVHKLQQMLGGAENIAAAWLEDGIKDLKGDIIAPGLNAVVRAVSKLGARDLFQAYLKARRISDDLSVQREDAEGNIVGPKETSENIKNAEEAVRELEEAFPQFRPLSQQVFLFTDGLLTASVDGGILTQAEADRIKSVNSAYTPYHRIIENAMGASQGLTGGGRAFKAFTGERNESTSPALEALVGNVATITRAIGRQRVVSALNDLAAKPGAGHFVESLPDPPNRPTSETALAVIEQLIKKGILPEDMDQLITAEMAETILTFYNTTGRYGSDEPIFTGVIDGERKYFRVKDRAFLDALVNSHPETSKLTIGILSKVAEILRESATLTLSFAFRNIGRDTFAAGINSKSGFIPILDSAAGLLQILTNSDDYKRVKASGALQSGFFSQSKENQQKIIKNSSRTVIQKIVHNTILSPLDGMRVISAGLENATRVGEFMKAEKKALDQDMTKEEAFAHATYSAREVTLDFHRGGMQAKQWNRYSAFFNATLLGHEKMVRQLKEDPAGTLSRIALFIGVPTILSALQMRDDEEYEERPRWEKDAYWHFRLPGSDELVRFPKPHGYGYIFGNGSTRMLELIESEDPGNDFTKMTKDLGRDTINAMVQAAIPTAIQPMAEVMANYSLFRRQDIVNAFTAKLPVEEQANRWTGATARAISQLLVDVHPSIGISPAHIEHMVYGHTAGMGRTALDIIDSVIEDPDAPTTPKRRLVETIPGIKVFVSANPRASAQSIRDLYETRNELDTLMQRIETAAGQGDRAKVKKLREDNKALLLRRGRVKSATDSLKPAWKRIQAIYANKTMTAEEKRAALDPIYERMVSLARKTMGKTTTQKPQTRQ